MLDQVAPHELRDSRGKHFFNARRLLLTVERIVAVVKLILRTVGEEMKIDSTDLDTS